MSQKIPAPIQPALQAYLSLMNERLPGLVNGFYLEGSIALGGFNERFSDIDFVTTLNRQATPIEIDTLRGIHKVIEERHPQWKMAGSYILSVDLGCWESKAEPNLYYHEGVLRPDGCFELQSVEGWILKNHGIVLIGPEPRDLPFTVEWDLLITRMRENLNTYWVSWTRRPDRLAALLSDWGIQWAVLGVLRQFYSFREESITTKSKAGKYALTCVPSRWRQLIQEALNIREGETTSAYRFRVGRGIEAIRFLKYIIQTCNTSHA